MAKYLKETLLFETTEDMDAFQRQHGIPCTFVFFFFLSFAHQLLVSLPLVRTACLPWTTTSRIPTGAPPTVFKCTRREARACRTLPWCQQPASSTPFVRRSQPFLPRYDRQARAFQSSSRLLPCHHAHPCLNSRLLPPQARSVLECRRETRQLLADLKGLQLAANRREKETQLSQCGQKHELRFSFSIFFTCFSLLCRHPA